jgi:hypothetical protein
MLRPIAENLFEERQITEFQFAKILFAEKSICHFFLFWETAYAICQRLRSKKKTAPVVNFFSFF